MTYTNFEEFGERFWNAPAKRSGDVRSPYERDRGRVIHSAAFRRLQGKTQVMGAGEGDFHRTRLTHSIECAQIGAGLLQVLEAKRFTLPQDLQPWLPERDLVEAACFAHDLGHPPFGHGGEQALQARMWNHGGFEGNGQTLRIITKLEKYTAAGWGTNPTRRLILAVLKYPIPYSGSNATDHQRKPPKCYFDEERPLVEWALSALPAADVSKLAERDEKLKARHRTFDCSLMELADDIAYGVHDIEDIVARQLAPKEHVLSEMTEVFNKLGRPVLQDGEALTAERITRDLFGGGFERKRRISALVNLFVTSVAVERKDGFGHPLLAYRVTLSTDLDKLLDGLKKMAFSLVISHAEVRQLEERGKRVVAGLLEVLAQKPGELVPAHSWAHPQDTSAIVIGQQVGQIARFRLEIAAGDVVITPDANTELLRHGVVAPDPSYFYVPNDAACPYPHRRKVTWAAEPILRSGLSVPVQNTLRSSLTVFGVSQTEDVLKAVGLGHQAPAPAATPYNPYHAVLTQVLTLDDKEFEILVAHLLTAIGFEGSEVTGKSGDGGVDAIGELNVANLAKVKVFVQAKRFKLGTKIQAKTVRELRQAIPFGGQGAFITTADFQDKALGVALETGFPRIGLINGNQLVDLLVEHWDDIPAEFQKRLGLKSGLVLG